MSPPLVVAFALAGRIDVDLDHEPLGKGSSGREIYLRDVWPSNQEIGEALGTATDAETYRRLYRDFQRQNPLSERVPGSTGKVYD